MYIMTEFEPELVMIQAASTEPDAGLVELLLEEVQLLAHSEERAIQLSSAKQTFGWNFYLISIDKSIVLQIAQLPESSFLQAKGDSLEQKFVFWLNQRAKAKGSQEKVHFDLLSDLKSSRYGLF